MTLYRYAEKNFIRAKNAKKSIHLGLKMIHNDEKNPQPASCTETQITVAFTVAPVFRETPEIRKMQKTM